MISENVYPIERISGLQTSSNSAKYIGYSHLLIYYLLSDAAGFVVYWQCYDSI